MAFSDPQSLTINGSAISLPRTNVDGTLSEYTTADGAYRLSVAHSVGTRKSHRVKLENQKVAADPFTTGVNKAYSGSVSLVVNEPALGFTDAELAYMVAALCAWHTASTNANTLKVLGGES